MPMTAEQIVRRLHDTKAVSLWNHKTGPIFWYAASVPGPFYVNTELMIGPALSAALLKSITQIVAEEKGAEEKAAALEALLMQAYDADATYRDVIDALGAKAQEAFSPLPALISGGERRDWLFSVPLAKKLGLRHVYLFKNGSFYCKEPLAKGETALHVADLINNAASYFDAWLPILQKAELTCTKTLCVNCRGSNGAARLAQAGVTVASLCAIDVGFFEKSLASGLIDESTLEELKLFFQSAQDWAARYVMDRPALFDADAIDAKSFERLRTFFTKDPWNLRPAHAAFFAHMDEAIKKRDKSEA